MLNLLKKWGGGCKRRKERQKITAVYFLYNIKEHPAIVWPYFYPLFFRYKNMWCVSPTQWFTSSLYYFSVDLSGSVFTFTPRDNWVGWIVKTIWLFDKVSPCVFTKLFPHNFKPSWNTKIRPQVILLSEHTGQAGMGLFGTWMWDSQRKRSRENSILSLGLVLFQSEDRCLYTADGNARRA